MADGSNLRPLSRILICFKMPLPTTETEFESIKEQAALMQVLEGETVILRNPSCFDFSQDQMTSVQSGAPPCAIRTRESDEKEMETNSFDMHSVDCSMRRRLRPMQSKMVTVALSDDSETAKNLRLGEMAIATMSSVFSVPGMNF